MIPVAHCNLGSWLARNTPYHCGKCLSRHLAALTDGRSGVATLAKPGARQING